VSFDAVRETPASRGRTMISRFGRVAAILLLSIAAACASKEQKVEKYAESGRVFLEKGDLGRANVQFQNALKINEEYVPALEGIAEIAERKHDFQTMFGVLQQIVRLQPQNVDAQTKLGKLYLIGGDEKSALESADKALAVDGRNADALALKAAIQLRLGDHSGAVTLAEQAIAINPASAEATAVLAAVRSADKDYEGALAIVEKALAVKVDQSVLHLIRLPLLNNLGRKAELLAAHQELIDLYPQTVAYRQMYAVTLIRERNIPEARKQLLEIVRLSPGKVDPVLDLVRLDYRSQGSEAARKTFQDYVEAQPKDVELKFAFAAFLRDLKDVAGADAMYRTLQATAGDKAIARRAQNEIAALRLIEGKTDEAAKIVDEILAEDARDSDALLRRASIRIAAGEYDQAVTDLRTVLADKPDSIPAKMLIASAFEKKGDVEYASSQMAQAVIDSGYASRPTTVFAQFLIRHRDVPRAEKALLDSLAKHPQDLENLKLLAAVRLMTQNWRGAEETAKLIERANSEDESVSRILGAAYTGLKDYSGVITTLTEAGEQTPLAAQPLAMLVDAYVKDGRAEEAEAMLSAMIDKDPANYSARLLLAQVYQAQKRPDDVEKTLKDAILIEPERGEAVEALYRIYRLGGRNADAEAVVAAATGRAPTNDGFKMLRADYLLSTGQREEATAVYADVLERRPNDLIAANNYASLLLEIRDDAASKAKALEVARTLEKQDNPLLLDTLGWAQYHNGDYVGAAETLERVVSYAPDFAEANYHLGAALVAKGEVDAGKAALRRAVEKGGEAAFVAKAKELLERY